MLGETPTLYRIRKTVKEMDKVSSPVVRKGISWNALELCEERRGGGETYASQPKAHRQENRKTFIHQLHLK